VDTVQLVPTYHSSCFLNPRFFDVSNELRF
jgi:hypothetical protein